MVMLAISSFAGISPKTPSRYLQDSQAQVAINCPVFSGSLQPLPNVGSSVLTLPKEGTPVTIYRFGQDVVSDSQYWFHWPFDVDVCRSQVSGDTSEWTFYTGDGAPKATYGQLALSGAQYPAASRPLGLPTPTQSLIASPQAFSSSANPAEVTLTPTHLSQLSTEYGIKVSLTDAEEASFQTVALPATDAVTVAAALDAVTGITAVASDGTVTVATDLTGDAAKLYVKYQTGLKQDTTGTFTYAGYDSGTKTGTANTSAMVVLLDSEIGSISAFDTITVKTANATHINGAAVTGTHDAASFATWLNARLGGALVATARGSCVTLTPGTAGIGASESITYTRSVGASVVTTLTAAGSESAGPARVFVTQTEVDDLEGHYLSALVNDNEYKILVPATASVSNLSGLGGYGLSVTVYGAISPFAVVATQTVGSSVSLRLREGTYSETPAYAQLVGTGYVDSGAIPETRVYTWTWVNKESGYEFESGPAGPSNTVDVYFGQTVSLSGFDTTPGGAYVATHRRIYRATAGVYQFVKEIPIGEVAVEDDVSVDDLAEELPTLTWAPPPDGLRGLINLPNGLMAGFTGRDVYFCDPYHPHAWPVQYNQSVDYPIVGLGRMDTTLAVLTQGTPYFIQGTHPDSMAVVKSDIEQACVAKRSIVSTNGAVLYASPDGLVMLSSSESRILTEPLFTRAQWQAYFKPESIHAYQHDLKYVAFYDNGTTQGGFIYDLTSGQFILHDIYAVAGYNDLRNDELYLAFADRTVKKWYAGAAKSFTWRSKKFTMPQVVGFSCAQIEAESYNLTAKFYTDGVLRYTHTVTGRAPFRLPVAVQGRDLEVQIEGDKEVFSISMAQSMQELALVLESATDG